MVDKPLRGGDWAGVLSSNDACGLSHSHPKVVAPDLAWHGREEMNIDTLTLASGGSYGSPAAASNRLIYDKGPSHLSLAILVCSQPC